VDELELEQVKESYCSLIRSWCAGVLRRCILKIRSTDGTESESEREREREREREKGGGSKRIHTLQLSFWL
jgi:hypothetical protein